MKIRKIVTLFCMSVLVSAMTACGTKKERNNDADTAVVVGLSEETIVVGCDSMDTSKSIGQSAEELGNAVKEKGEQVAEEAETKGKKALDEAKSRGENVLDEAKKKTENLLNGGRKDVKENL